MRQTLAVDMVLPLPLRRRRRYRDSGRGLPASLFACRIILSPRKGFTFSQPTASLMWTPSRPIGGRMAVPAVRRPSTFSGKSLIRLRISYIARTCELILIVGEKKRRRRSRRTAIPSRHMGKPVFVTASNGLTGMAPARLIRPYQTFWPTWRTIRPIAVIRKPSNKPFSCPF